MNLKRVLNFLLVFAPLGAFADGSLQDLLPAIGDLIKSIIPVAFGAGLLFFFWGLAKFILQAGDERAIEEGKRIMTWGLIALFCMASVWGIVVFLQQVIGLPAITSL